MSERAGLPWLPVAHEVAAAAGLLRLGRSALASYQTSDLDAEPVMAALAIGAEKMLKMTYGVIVTEESEAWPPVEVMRDRFRHQIVDLDEECRRRLRGRAQRETAPLRVNQLLDRAERDERLPVILKCLTEYARGGGFHHLDTLAADPPPRRSPQRMWEQLDNAVAYSHPRTEVEIGTTEEAFQRVRQRVNDQLYRTVFDWQFLYFHCWNVGVCGRDAQLHSIALEPRS